MNWMFDWFLTYALLVGGTLLVCWLVEQIERVRFVHRAARRRGVQGVGGLLLGPASSDKESPRTVSAAGGVTRSEPDGDSD